MHSVIFFHYISNLFVPLVSANLFLWEMIALNLDKHLLMAVGIKTWICSLHKCVIFVFDEKEG